MLITPPSADHLNDTSPTVLIIATTLHYLHRMRRLIITAEPTGGSESRPKLCPYVNFPHLQLLIDTTN
jgi:hypothetical protein